MEKWLSKQTFKNTNMNIKISMLIYLSCTCTFFETGLDWDKSQLNELNRQPGRWGYLGMSQQWFFPHPDAKQLWWLLPTKCWWLCHGVKKYSVENGFQEKMVHSFLSILILLRNHIEMLIKIRRCSINWLQTKYHFKVRETRVQP